MLPHSALYASVLPTPHKRAVRIEITDIDGNPRATLSNRDEHEVISGEVRAVMTNRVTRSATFTLADEWYPRLPTDPLAPEAAVAHISAGVRYGDGSEEVFPVFTGRIFDVTRNPDGSVDFACEDLAQDVIGFRFEQPRVSQRPGILQEIRELILEALPQAVFGTDTVADGVTPPLTWDEDRGQALDDLAEALGGRWFSLGDGSFVVRPFTYAPGPVVRQYFDGPGGLLSTATVTRTRSGVANSVIVVSERADGTTPVRVPARDTATGSPTQFGGLFGRVSQVIKVQTPLTTGQAQVFARTQLRAATALTEQWTATLAYADHALEPGDTVQVGYRGVLSEQVVDQVSYPLGVRDTMQISGRATVPEE
jgi:Domain of unknown function (DUF5047)/Putative phage tail protein